MPTNIKIFLRQLWRSKKRLILNIVLLTAATAFFIMSLNLYHNSTANLRQVEETYSTLATVTFFGDMNRQGNLTRPEAEDFLGYGTMLPRDYDLTPLLDFDYVKGFNRGIRCEAYIPGTPAVSTTIEQEYDPVTIMAMKLNKDDIYLQGNELMLRFTIDSEVPIHIPLVQNNRGRWEMDRGGFTLPVKVTASALEEISYPGKIRLSVYNLKEADIRQLNRNDETHQLTLYPGVEYVYAGMHYFFFHKDPESGMLSYAHYYAYGGSHENGGQFTLYEKPPYYLFDSAVGYYQAGSPYYDKTQNSETDSRMFQRWEDVQRDPDAAARWDELWRGIEYSTHSFSVTLTDDIAKLPVWHLSGLYLHKGRLITPEEYKSGAKVCMVTKKMAELQDWKLGDKLEMHLFSNLEYTADIGTAFLNYPGYNYTTEFFDTDTYEIVGILDQREILGTSNVPPDPFYQPWNTIYAPAASAPNAPAAELQPLQPSLLSIELENGTIDAYLEEMKALGVTEKTAGQYTLEIHCYDQGYSVVQPGLVRMRSMAQLLLIFSVVLLLTTLVLVAYFFAQHQKVSAGILRMLGGTNPQVLAGILACALVVVLVGAAIGGVAGGVLSQNVGQRVLAADAARQEAMKEFSTDLVNARNTVSTGISVGADPLITGLGALSIVCSFLLLLGLFVGNYLKIEPCELLTQRR